MGADASTMDRLPASEAFRRLLAEACHSEQARVDALVALAQRTIFAAVWAGPREDIRTLSNTLQVSVMPLYTQAELLAEAARRYGWQEPDGHVEMRELSAPAALRQALSRQVDLVAIDLGQPHAMELTQDEVEALVRGAKVDSEGPFAAAGRVTSELMDAVRRSTPPPGGLPPITLQSDRPPASRATPPPRIPTLRPSGPVVTAQPATAQPAPAPLPLSTEGLSLHPADRPLPEIVLTALADRLRELPEVEWAAACAGRCDDGPPRPLIALRVDPGYRERVPSIAAAVHETGHAASLQLDTVLLDDADLMRQAREQGEIFYPWRS